MFFRQLQLGSMDNFCYLVGCEKTKECGVIDCGFGHEKLLSTAEKNNYGITKIFLTHFHYDHSAEAEKLAEKTGAKIYGHKSAKTKKSSPGLFVIPQNLEGLEDRDEIVIGTIKGQAYYTPGHESSHLAYEFDKHFFTGDLLFIGKSGRTDLPDSDPQAMKESLALVRTLPDDWTVYPGHDYGEVPFRSLREEKEKNPYLRGEKIR